MRALDARGVAAQPAVWDDPDVDWAAFDAVVVRSTWDYSARRDEFVAWASRVPHILNAEQVLRWNTDKGYLRELEGAGIPVIPTLWLDPARNLSSRAIHTRLPAQGDFVIKPVVSAGAKDTGRYQAGAAHSRGLARQPAETLRVAGRAGLGPPDRTRAAPAGDPGLVCGDGECSHAVRKNALLTGPHRPTRGLYQQEEMSPFTASDEQLDVARRALAVAADAVGGGDPASFLYARVDVVTGNDDWLL